MRSSPHCVRRQLRSLSAADAAALDDRRRYGFFVGAGLDPAVLPAGFVACSAGISFREAQYESDQASLGYDGYGATLWRATDGIALRFAADAAAFVQLARGDALRRRCRER